MPRQARRSRTSGNQRRSAYDDVFTCGLTCGKSVDLFPWRRLGNDVARPRPAPAHLSGMLEDELPVIQPAIRGHGTSGWR
jgi:hypothetical protein